MIEVPANIPLPAPRGERVALVFARAVALLACLIGALVLAGWLLDFPALNDPLPDFTGMHPNAAAGIVAAGLGLFFLTYRALRPLAWLIAVALVLLGTASVAQDLFGLDLGIDQALFAGARLLDAAVHSAPLGRMMPAMAGLLILFGLALLCAKGDRLGSALSQFFALA